MLFPSLAMEGTASMAQLGGVGAPLNPTSFGLFDVAAVTPLAVEPTLAAETSRISDWGLQPEPLPTLFSDRTSLLASLGSHSVSPDLSGARAIQFLGDRGGVSFLARNPNEIMRVLREEYGDVNYQKIAFLFEDNDISRARMQSVRARVAERTGHWYPNLKEVQAVVRNVLAEDGIDLNAWREGRRRHHEASGSDFRGQQLDIIHDDILAGVLLIQLLPDDLPLYRSTESEHVGQAGEGGSSWWGGGDDGMGVAVNYASEGRIVMQTTLGDLRGVGVIRRDDVAVVGNALELYHREANGGEVVDGSEWTRFRYEELRADQITFSPDHLSPAQRREFDGVLAGRDPNQLTIGGRKDILFRLVREHSWGRQDIEGLVGADWARIALGYDQKLAICLPEFP